MPSAFTDLIADDLLQEHGRNLMSIQVILPGGSGIIPLKNALKNKAAGQALLLPVIQSMDDFANLNAGIRRVSPEKSLLVLYHAFRTHHNPDESLANFLQLGQQLLADFDMILRAGRKPAEVFAGMKQWESAGAAFADFMDEEQKQLMRNFSALFHDDLGGKRARFLRLWENLAAIFLDYENKLLSAGLGTPGMIYREAVHKIRRSPLRAEDKYYFAGFSTLSFLEISMMKDLAKKNAAGFAWDLMPAFLEKNTNEVKTVYQRLHSVPEFRPSLDKWLRMEKAESYPQVREVKCPGLSGMAQWMLSEEFSPEESLVFIVSNPAMIQMLAGKGNLKNGQAIRFSMGYPLNYTPLARWLFRVFSWVSREQKENVRHFFPLLEDWHFSFFFPGTVKVAKTLFRESEKTALSSIRQLPDLPEWFFAESAPAFFQQFTSWLRAQCEQTIEDALLCSSLSETTKLFEGLKDALSMAGDSLSFPVLQTFVYNQLKSASLASSLSKESSVEAMGLFESRVLDYQRIVICPGDEGMFPTAPSRQTMLPHSVRRAFGLPLPQMETEEQAWQFYRLCKRAKEVVFLISDSGEHRRSRFLDQIEISKIYPFRQEEMKFRYTLLPAPAIMMKRNDSEMQRVRQFSGPKGTVPERKFSPTSLHALLTCPLRFHYQKIKGLKEPEVFSETGMNALDYGKWVHGGIQFLLEEKGKDGRFFKTSDYTEMELEWDRAASLVWNSIPDKTSLGQLSDFPIEMALGKIMAQRFFSFMKTHKPHRWIANEYDFPDVCLSSGSQNWLLSGRADIVFEEEDCYRFLDLKTGAFTDKKKLYLKVNEEGEPDENKMVENKDYFQMLIYNRVAAADPAFRQKKVEASLFYLANPKPQLASPLEKVIAENTEQEFYRQFDHQLIRHLEEFGLETSIIRQTDDPKNCVWCSFNAMCRR